MQLNPLAGTSGFDVTYSTDVDTMPTVRAVAPQGVLLDRPRRKYWTKRDVQRRPERSGCPASALRSSARMPVHWQARLEARTPPSPSGAGLLPVLALDRCRSDHHAPNGATPCWNRPEQILMVSCTPRKSGGAARPYVVHEQLSQWAVPGHRLKDGDSVAGIVGYEMDRFMPTYTAPTAISQTLLSKSPFVLYHRCGRLCQLVALSGT